MEKEGIKACTSCNIVPTPYSHHEDGSVYYNLICACKKTPLERCSLGANTHEWNTTWFDTDPETVNRKAGFEISEGYLKKFHYYK